MTLTLRYREVQSFVTSLRNYRKWLRAHQEKTELKLRSVQLLDRCERDRRWAPAVQSCPCAVDEVCDPLAEVGSEIPAGLCEGVRIYLWVPVVFLRKHEAVLLCGYAGYA